MHGFFGIRSAPKLTDNDAQQKHAHAIRKNFFNSKTFPALAPEPR
jgi:hypothetical protein